jgi:hypothetical protein
MWDHCSQVRLTEMSRYSTGAKLAGVIYVHRISDVKFGGLAIKNFRMFQELCGEKTLKNVVLVTNMWGQVSPKVGAGREKRLKNNYFRAAIEKGAQLHRHKNTPESAQAILREILKNQPVVLKIQRELIDEHKEIGQTGAGAELNREIREVVEKFQREIRELEENMCRAMEKRDEEFRKELEEEKRRMQQAIEELQKASAKMEVTVTELRGELANKWNCVIA